MVSAVRGGVGAGKILIFLNPDRAFVDREDAKVGWLVCVFLCDRVNLVVDI